MSFTDPRFWLDLLQWVVLLFVGGFVWIRKPGETAVGAVNDLRRQITDEVGRLSRQLTDEVRELSVRQAKLESDMQSTCTSDELAKVAGEVRVIDERTRGIGESVGVVRGQLNRIETFLLSERHK